LLANGLYGLDYRATYEGEEDGGTALAALRDGQILGSDPWGGVFRGCYEFDPDSDLNVVRLKIEVPPEEMLVTGFSAGPDGATVDIVGAFGASKIPAVTVVTVGGHPLQVRLSYLGPLPG